MDSSSLSKKIKADLDEIANTCNEKLVEYIATYLAQHGATSITKPTTSSLTCDVVGTAPPKGAKFILGLVTASSVHTHPLLVAATSILQAKEKIPSNNTIRFIFKYAQSKALEDINEVYAIQDASLPIDKVAVTSMVSVAIPFEIKILGKGVHGAYPEMGCSPILALCQTHAAIQMVENCAITEIHAGDAENVIPGSGTMSGVIKGGKLEEVKAVLEKIVGKVPNSLDCKGSITYGEGVDKGKESCEALKKCAINSIGKDLLIEEVSTADNNRLKWGNESTKGAVMFAGEMKDATAIMKVWINLVESRLNCTLSY